ncbi:hypothetical protein MNBD_GAMMA18-559 [hydrothermal vent metagenome]|uniref:Uncharacterized protein n=1 Tax=hydrothermal vent metagenome TaxID=652676 RepID=A0A3B0ZX41_9ZZZZ
MNRTITKTKSSVTVPADGELHSKHFNEAEIHRRAEADPDAKPLTVKQLAKFKRVNPFVGHKSR